MERTLSQEERIKRAEEIYYRRQNAKNMGKTATVNITPKKNYKLLRRVIIQIIICVGIYSVIYKLQSNTDSFSVDSIDYLKEAIAYDIDINKAFEELKNQMNKINLINKETKQDENNIIENQTTNENAELSSNLVEATLSVSEQAEVNTTEVVEEASSVSQIEQDAEYIKNNFSFIKPVEGTVTSRFGLRNPTTETVPKYHTGIDIGVVEGTVFVAAMEGTVELVSSVGDYRKPCKNNKWRCINTICSLQNNLCKRRGQNITRTANWRNRKHRKCNRTTFAF